MYNSVSGNDVHTSGNYLGSLQYTNKRPNDAVGNNSNKRVCNDSRSNPEGKSLPERSVRTFMDYFTDMYDLWPQIFHMCDIKTILSCQLVSQFFYQLFLLEGGFCAIPITFYTTKTTISCSKISEVSKEEILERLLNLIKTKRLEITFIGPHNSASNDHLTIFFNEQYNGLCNYITDIDLSAMSVCESLQGLINLLASQCPNLKSLSLNKITTLIILEGLEHLESFSCEDLHQDGTLTISENLKNLKSFSCEHMDFNWSDARDLHEEDDSPRKYATLNLKSSNLEYFFVHHVGYAKIVLAGQFPRLKSFLCNFVDNSLILELPEDFPALKLISISACKPELYKNVQASEYAHSLCNKLKEKIKSFEDSVTMEWKQEDSKAIQEICIEALTYEPTLSSKEYESFSLNLAIAQLNLKNYWGVEDICFLSLQNDIISNQTKALLYYYLGEARLNLQNYSGAEEAFRLGLNLNDADNSDEDIDDYTKAWLYYGHGQALFQLKKYKDAEDACLFGLQISEIIDQLEIKNLLHLQLSYIYQIQQNFIKKLVNDVFALSCLRSLPNEDRRRQEAYDRLKANGLPDYISEQLLFSLDREEETGLTNDRIWDAIWKLPELYS